MTQEKKITKFESRPPVPAREQRTFLAPACDVYENADEFLLMLDVPGVTREHVDIEFHGGELLLEARQEAGSDEGTALGSEYRPHDFRRRFAVPGGIETGSVTAELSNGVLTLHLPKSEERKPRQIPVQSG